MTTNVADFLKAYRVSMGNHHSKAQELVEFCKESLSDRNYDLHLVEGRAKEPASLEEKILRKGYTDLSQVTDLYGVRVITYYSNQVDAIVERLRQVLILDDANCLDKRSGLHADRKFGYRSVHLVGHVARASRRWKNLSGQVFEIQIRSLLDQAWAEIEHEVVYKSGVTFPEEVRRRFAAIAANFELLENEFLALKGNIWKLVEEYLGHYRSGQSQLESFDAARLAAALEFLRPNGLSWRQSAQDGLIPVATPAAGVRGLDAIHVHTLNRLAEVLESKDVAHSLEGVASLAGTTPAELSHPLVVAVVVGIHDWGALERHLPMLADATEVRRVLAPEDAAVE